MPRPSNPKYKIGIDKAIPGTDRSILLRPSRMRRPKHIPGSVTLSVKNLMRAGNRWGKHKLIAKLVEEELKNKPSRTSGSTTLVRHGGCPSCCELVPELLEAAGEVLGWANEAQKHWNISDEICAPPYIATGFLKDAIAKVEGRA